MTKQVEQEYDIAPWSFEGETIDLVVDNDGQYWVPGVQIGRVLGYLNSTQSIANLHNRNADILEDPLYKGVINWLPLEAVKKSACTPLKAWLSC